MIKLAAAWFCLCILGLFAPSSEFGRPIGMELLAAIASSLALGIGVLAPICIVASLFGVATLDREQPQIALLAHVFADIIDAVPSVLWVLVIVLLVDEPRRVAAVVAFTVVCLPGSVRVVLGECGRQRSAAYLLAARALGASASRLFFRHLAPNATSTWTPYGAQLFGSAIAVDGAIGLLGAGNRSDLNLGMMLLRGKEQLMFSPWLLGLTLLAYLAIFTTLYIIIDKARADQRIAGLADFSSRS